MNLKNSPVAKLDQWMANAGWKADDTFEGSSRLDFAAGIYLHGRPYCNYGMPH